MTIVDTTVWIDYFAGTVNSHTLWLDRALGRLPIGLTDLILLEILQGVRDDPKFNHLRRELLKMQIFETGGVPLALAAAQNYRELRAAGITVRKTIDCLIATFCLLNGHSLLHRDRDFDPFEKYMGLQVIHP